MGVKSVAWSARKSWQNRDKIFGAGAGLAEAGFTVASDTTSHVVFQKRGDKKLAQLESIADSQRVLGERFRKRVSGPGASSKTVLDTLAIGGETLATHLRRGEIPEDIQRAYEVAYPILAADIGDCGKQQPRQPWLVSAFIYNAFLLSQAVTTRCSNQSMARQPVRQNRS